jgi:predicted HTH transcriptional regulator
VWNFPYVAIEEALVNAVYHRAYEVREPIEVRISHDELGFPGPIARSKPRISRPVVRSAAATATGALASF